MEVKHMKPQYVKHKDQKMMQIHTAMKQADMSLISPSRDFKGGEKSAHTCLNLPKISVLRIFLNVDSRSVLLQKIMHVPVPQPPKNLNYTPLTPTVWQQLKGDLSIIIKSRLLQ